MNIYGEIVFCNDSVLRIKSEKGGKSIYYPLHDVQTYFKEDDLCILHFMKQSATIEEGTTLANIILALEPWNKIISYYIGRDLAAYCAACKTLGSTEQEFSFLEISRYYSTGRVFKYAPLKDFNNLNDYFNSNHRTPTDLFYAEERISMCGFNDGDNNNYSMSDCAFSKLRNTPVILVSRQTNSFCLIDDKVRLFNNKIKGIHQDKKGYALYYSKAEFTLNDIIEAVFEDGLFYEKPVSEESSAAFYDMLQSSLEEAKELIESKKKPVLKLVSEDLIVKSGGAFNNRDEQNNVWNNLNKLEVNSNNDNEIKVVVNPGAFDEVMEEEIEKDDIWNDIYKSLVSSSCLKIGELQISVKEVSSRENEQKSE